MRIIFIGTGAIGVPTLQALLNSRDYEVVAVVTRPDKPAGRSQQLQPPPVKQAATGSAPLFQPARIREERAVAELRALAPDLVVVMAYGQILPKSVLEIPRLACLNLHASLLPRHRGAAPIQAAIVAGDCETGITVMYMDEGLDTGDILLQKTLAIAPDETGGSLHDRLADLAPGALLEALPQLAKNCAPREPQDAERASYAPKLSRETGRIDWSEPAETIERKIRAYDPWPGAFTEITESSARKRHLKIFCGTVCDENLGRPGMVSLPDNSEILVATGRGALRIEEVQLEGKRRLRTPDFLRGFSSPTLHF
jgi:methionyl-tRNA formyltransferase